MRFGMHIRIVKILMLTNETELNKTLIKEWGYLKSIVKMSI